jgi:hypothetical protein
MVAKKGDGTRARQKPGTAATVGPQLREEMSERRESGPSQFRKMQATERKSNGVFQT